MEQGRDRHTACTDSGTNPSRWSEDNAEPDRQYPHRTDNPNPGEQPMAQVRIEMHRHRTVGYTRLRREWRNSPPVEKITIEREASDPPQALRITIKTSPPVTWPIVKTLGAPQRIRKIDGDEFNAALRAEKLGAMREGEPEARIHVTVHDGASPHDDPVAQVGGEWSAFAIEAWNTAPSGVGPERPDEDEERHQDWKDEGLRWARFVTPNARIIDSIVGEVVQRARAHGKRVRSVPQWCAETALTRLKHRGWGYARHTNVVYPADALAQRKAGSCADSSVTFAAAMLAMGIRPVLVLMDGHMMAGVWTKKRVSGRAIYDQAGHVLEMVRSGCLTLVETTGIYSGRKKINAAKMVRKGRKTLRRRVHEFGFAIDVEAAHCSGYPPLEPPPSP